MPRTLSSRVIIITMILIALTVIAVSANWSGLGISQFVSAETAIDQETLAVAAEPRVMTTPLNAITTFDAALIARHVVEVLPALIANQLTVARVTGQTQVSSLDAALVANYVVNNGGTGSTGTLVPPGLLMGDVSGAGPHYDGSPGTPTVSLPTLSATPGILLVPVTVGDVTGLGAISFEFQVTFDPTVLQPVLPSPFSTAGTLTGDGTWQLF